MKNPTNRIEYLDLARAIAIIERTFALFFMSEISPKISASTPKT